MENWCLLEKWNTIECASSYPELTGKAAFLGKTKREIIYFSLFSTRVAFFPGNTNNDFRKTCIMVLFYVGKLAWYPKGHLVSLGHFTNQLWKWPRGDVCACFLLDLQYQWDRIWKILSSRLQFYVGSFRPLILGLWGGFGMFVLFRSSREREKEENLFDTKSFTSEGMLGLAYLTTWE